MRIVLIDDTTQRAKVWAADLEKLGLPDVRIEVPSNADVASTLKVLNTRRFKARKDEKWRDEPCDLDGADILLLDFDLIDVGDDKSEFSTGEEIAYLARLFSSANVICVVNQFGMNRFDLTLKADLATRNDLDLGSNQISNPGLWKHSDAWRGYRPWHWPVLTEEVALYEKRLDDVRNNIAAPLLAYFGFDPKRENPGRSLSVETLAYFKGEPDKITLGSAAASSSFMHPKDVAWLEKDQEQLARVSTAVMQKWLKRCVLVRQDVLVDVPHLIVRKPWLLKTPSDRAVWDAAIGPKPRDLLLDAVHKYGFKAEQWLGRTTYWGEEVNADPDLTLPKGKWNYAAIPELVFREDTSTFGTPSESLEFECGLGTSYDLRYVADPKKHEKHQGPLDVQQVEYVPAIKLLM